MKKSKIGFLISVSLFAFVGILVKNIDFPSGAISFVRGVIGFLFLSLMMPIKGIKSDINSIKKNLLFLILSGMAIGINWILLFESYNYTTVATATVCYYMAPLIFVFISSIIFREKLQLKQIVCFFTALFGLVLVSGILTSEPGKKEITGIILGLLAAVFYATVTTLNKFIKDIDAYNKTRIQILSAAIVVLPYSFICETVTKEMFNFRSIVFLIVLGALITGFSYSLYFDGIGKLPSTTVAIWSYLDPALSIILSAVILREIPDIYGVIGSILIIGASIASEIKSKENT